MNPWKKDDSPRLYICKKKFYTSCTLKTKQKLDSKGYRNSLEDLESFICR